MKDQQPPIVAAIVLAAGASTRFGSPKQLLDWRGRPLLQHVIWQVLAAPVCEIVVALGAHYARVAPLIYGLPVTLTHNADWEAGLSSSVALGLRALRRRPDAAVFLLADQPGASPELITRLIRSYADARAPIVLPRVHGQRGNPALFASELFSELMQVTGDQGGRALLTHYWDDIAWVDADERALFDIDEPEDIASAALIA